MLARFLHLFYNGWGSSGGGGWKKGVVVFIDDFDLPIQQALVNKQLTEQDVAECKGLVTTLLLSVLKCQSSQTPVVERALFAGNYAVTLNNFCVMHVGIHPSQATRFFGFTEPELEMLCACYNVNDRWAAIASKRFNGRY